MLKAPTPQGIQDQLDWFAYEGGLDMVTPDIRKKPGSLINCINWEIPSDGGYRRLMGYERFDGRTKPSDAAVTILQSNAPLGGSLAVGDTINGQSSGCTAVCIYISSDRMWLACTKVSSSFTAGENIRKSTTVLGVNSTITVSVSSDLGNQLVALAAAQYRADITAVPGSGPIRGVWVYNDVEYAWRDNAGGTACVMHKATSGGWVAVTLAEEVYFSNANTSVQVGDTLTQGAVTATIRRVIVQTGTLLSGTNTGKLVISGRSGGNFAVGAATSTGGGGLSLTDPDSDTIVNEAQSFPAGGKYGFRNHNFGGAAATYRMYGWNGVGRAFEFDGTYLAFIDTGMAQDTPKFGEIHLNTLWLTFDASLQKSAPADPHSWSAVLGAAEFACGATITGIKQTVGSEATAAMLAFTEDRTFALYGRTSSEFALPAVLPETGARPYTVQNISDTLFLDDLGVTSVAVSDAYGNFADSELSALIKPYVMARIDNANCSVVVRNEGQYKLFFSDGFGITATFKNRKLLGMMPFFLPDVMNVACESEKNGGMILCGGADGFVYELNKGRSFDGEAINHSIQLAFNHVKSPQLRKRMKRFRIDVSAPGYHTLQIGHVAGRYDQQIDYGSAGQNGNVTGGLGGFDDSSTGWDFIGFDGTQITKLNIGLNVTTTDISLIFAGSSDRELAFTFSGQSMRYTPRRMDRR